MRLDQRLVNVAQDIADLDASLARIEIGNRLDRFYPTGRIRRYVDGLLVVFLDAADRLAQVTMQGREVREVFSHGVIDSIELALDDPLLRLATRGEQHVTVAGCKVSLRARNGPRRDPKALVQRQCCRLDGRMRRRTNQVKRRNDQDDPEQCRRDRPWCDAEHEAHDGNPAVLVTRRPVALRSALSNAVP